MSEALNLSSDQFSIPLRILSDPQQGSLLVPTTEQLDRKWADVRDASAIAVAGQSEDDRAQMRASNEAAETLERHLYAEVESTRAADLATFSFTFRVPTIEDHEAAEFAARKGDQRSEIAYRRELAQRTFIATDFPGYKDMGSLPAGIAVLVLAGVAARLSLSADIRAFIRRPA